MFADIITIIVCLFFSAFFSGMETALLGLGPLNMARGRSDRLFGLYQIKSRLLATLLIGNNFTIVLAALALHRFLGESANIWQTILAFTAEIFLFFIIAEALPKSIFKRLELRMLDWFYWPLRFFYFIFRPLSFLFLYLTRAIFRLVPENRELVKEDVFYFLSSHLPQDKTNVTENLLGLNTTKAKEVMTPLPMVSSIEKNATVSMAVGLLQSTHYSRYPVYEGRGDNILGYISVEDLLKSRPNEKVAGLTKVTEFVPDTMSADQLLFRMQSTGQSVAFVVNEFGAVVGMVTLEDIAEELVGDIHSSEREEETPSIIYQGDGTYLVDGSTDIDDFNHYFSISIGKDDFETIAGFINFFTGNIPEKGEFIDTPYGRFIVKEASIRAVTQVVFAKSR